MKLHPNNSVKRSYHNQQLLVALRELCETRAQMDPTQVVTVEYRAVKTYAQSRPYDCHPNSKWVIVCTPDNALWFINYEDVGGFCCDEASALGDDFDHLNKEDVVQYFTDYLDTLEIHSNPATTYGELMMGDKFEVSEYPDTIFMAMERTAPETQVMNNYNAVVVATKQRDDDRNLGLGDIRFFDSDTIVFKWETV